MIDAKKALNNLRRKKNIKLMDILSDTILRVMIQVFFSINDPYVHEKNLSKDTSLTPKFNMTAVGHHRNMNCIIYTEYHLILSSASKILYGMEIFDNHRKI